MYGFNHLLDTPKLDIQTYRGTSQSNTADWQTWIKPTGAKMIWMRGVGGGGSGGCGSNDGATGGGGAGGGSSYMSATFIPAIFVPDVLYIQAGAGGVIITPSSGQAGTNGVCSMVSVDTSGATPSLFLYSGGGFGGGAGSNTGTGGVAGAAGSSGLSSLAITPSQPLAGRGINNSNGEFTTTFNSGAGGQAGAAATASPANQLFSSSFFLGGCGGAGTATTIAAHPGGSVQVAVRGQVAGYETYSPVLGGEAAGNPTTKGHGGLFGSAWGVPMFASFPGGGGSGANNTVIAGAGGDGGVGCGGGGAGASFITQPTLAKPGNGGDGMVWMITYL
jgi:hypothetical protein